MIVWETQTQEVVLHQQRSDDFTRLTLVRLLLVDGGCFFVFKQDGITVEKDNDVVVEVVPRVNKVHFVTTGFRLWEDGWRLRGRGLARGIHTYQQTNGRETDVKVLRLKTKACGYLYYDLQVGAANRRQVVRHHQLQALEGYLHQLLTACVQAHEHTHTHTIRYTKSRCYLSYTRIKRITLWFKQILAK